MDILTFIVLSAINLLLMVIIVRKWSPVSPEGYCMVFLLAVVGVDNVTLLFHYFLRPETLELGRGEFDFRIFPTFVHIVGLLALMAGLWLPRRNPVPIRRDLNDSEMLSLRYIGFTLILLGLLIWVIGVRLAGVGFGAGFYDNLDESFRAGSTSAGSFWYRGTDIALFGAALALASHRALSARFFFTLILALAVRLLMTSNKGGFETVVTWFAVILYVYNRRLVRQFLNLRAAALLLLVAFLGIGLKFTLLSQERISYEALADTSTKSITNRYSDTGLYRGYCQFINSLPKYQYLFDGYRVGSYVFTSMVPRAIWPNKDVHPFTAIGFMVNDDFHNFEEEHSAVTLMGTAYADKGFYSLIVYMFAAGMFLTWLRTICAAPNRTIDSHAGLVLYCLLGGLSHEAGIIGLLVTLPLSFSFTFGSSLIVGSLVRRRGSPGGSLAAAPARVAVVGPDIR